MTGFWPMLLLNSLAYAGFALVLLKLPARLRFEVWATVVSAAILVGSLQMQGGLMLAFGLSFLGFGLAGSFDP